MGDNNNHSQICIYSFSIIGVSNPSVKYNFTHLDEITLVKNNICIVMQSLSSTYLIGTINTHKLQFKAFTNPLWTEVLSNKLRATYQNVHTYMSHIIIISSQNITHNKFIGSMYEFYVIRILRKINYFECKISHHHCVQSLLITLGTKFHNFWS